MNGIPLLEVRGLRTSFRAYSVEFDIVRDINLTLKKGEAHGILGESGSGKTVTGMTILRLLPDNAIWSAKKMNFHGEDISRLSDSEFQKYRGTRLAVVFQDPNTSFNPAKAIGWHFREIHRVLKSNPGMRFAGDNVAWSARSQELLKDVGIAQGVEVLEKYPHQLSGGMLQRVLIGLTLLMQPDLIIADEPTTNLDNIVEHQVIEIFRNLKIKHKVSFIFITHDMTIAESICDRISVMYAGEIVEVGPVSTILNNPKHPYSKGLVLTAQSLMRRDERLAEIPGDSPDPANPTLGCAFAPRCSYKLDRCSRETPQPVMLSSDHQVKCFLFTEKELRKNDEKKT